MKKHKAIIVWGTENARHAEEGEYAEIDNEPTVQEFATLAELDAYFTGIEDGDGWEMWHVMNTKEYRAYKRVTRKVAMAGTSAAEAGEGGGAAAV